MSEIELASFRDAAARQPTGVDPAARMTSLAIAMFRLSQWLKSPRPYLMLIGFAGFLGFWYLSVEVWKLPRFSQMPGPTEVLREWFSEDPTYGLSIFTPEYYMHIWVSIQRIAI